MTAQELMSDLRRCGPQSLSVTLYYISERLHELRTISGHKISDSSDAVEILRELAEAAKSSADRIPPALAHSAFQHAPILSTCPRCGHVHQGDRECGEEIGGGRICRCELEVPA